MNKDLRGYVEQIATPDIREFTLHAFEKAPQYFWTFPATSSGKYHPAWAAGPGGLVRHTIVGMYFVAELARTFNLTRIETDIALSASALHDTCKYGIANAPNVIYYDMHPFLPRSLYGGPSLSQLTTHFNDIMTAIERHMGSLLTGDWTSVGRLHPETPVEQVVHLADYLASRKKVWFSDFLGIKEINTPVK